MFHFFLLLFLLPFVVNKDVQFAGCRPFVPICSHVGLSIFKISRSQVWPILASYDLDLDLWPPDAQRWLFHAFAPRTTCGNLHRNRFRLFSKWHVHKGDGQMDEWTSRKLYAIGQSKLVIIAVQCFKSVFLHNFVVDDTVKFQRVCLCFATFRCVCVSDENQ